MSMWGGFLCLFLFKDVRRDVEWVATSVYAPHNANDSAVFWMELNQVASRWNRPWVREILMLLNFLVKGREVAL